jgi:cholesterol oxidase
LFCAEQRYQANILTEHLVDRIVPIDSAGHDQATAGGEHGFRVYYRDLTAHHGERSAVAKRVVVSAGSLGSTELLLRCRDVFKSLPMVSRALGQHLSGNGDFLGFVVGIPGAADPNYGPVITQCIDFNLFTGFNPDHAFILEDASYAAFGSWFVDGAKPGFLSLDSLWRTARSWLARIRGNAMGPIGYAFHDLLNEDLAYHTCVLLFMGVDNSNGAMSLGSNGWLDLDWPQADNRPLYNAILEVGEQFRRTTKARRFFALPNWWWPFRKNVSVHALGGCVLSNDPSNGVTSAVPSCFGQVHNYTNLYVADGAIVPNAVGANPTATISALSEMVAQGITGIAPTANL